MREIVSCRNTSASKSQKLTFTRRYTKWLKHNKHKVALQIMFVKTITKNKTELYFGMFNLTISYKDKIRLNFVVARISRKSSSWFDFFLCYVVLNEIKLGVEKIWCFHILTFQLLKTFQFQSRLQSLFSHPFSIIKKSHWRKKRLNSMDENKLREWVGSEQFGGSLKMPRI